MKPLFIHFLMLFNLSHISSQSIKTPSFDFGGSKSDWSHTLNDPDAYINPLFPTPSQNPKSLGHIFNAPIEMNNNIIFKINNYNNEAPGDVLASYDLKLGNRIWVKYFTPNKNDSIGYNFYLDMQKSQDANILLLGSRSNKKLPNEFSSTFGGFYSKTVIDQKNGEIISNKYISKINIGYLQGENALLLENNMEMKYAQYSNLSNLPYNLKIYPIYFDFINDTILNKFASTIELDTTIEIALYTRNNDGSANSPKISGPFSIKENENLYLAEYEQNGQSKHHLWKIDNNAKILMKKDISESLSGISKSDIYYSAVQSDSLILLTMATRDGTFERHRGYIFMDFDGNIVKKNTEIIIEGNKVGHLVTTPLKESNELVHAIRFQNSNDLFIYRETADKQYIKAAHLINPNSKAYAFVPLFQMQTSDDGIVVSGHITLDTVGQGIGACRFDCVGWPVIMKLSAETLGITSSTSDAWQDKVAFTIAPNPTSDLITITIAEGVASGSIQVTDQTGRIVTTQDIATSQTNIDISALPSGLYLVSLTDRKGKRVGQMQKVVKM